MNLNKRLSLKYTRLQEATRFPSLHYDIPAHIAREKLSYKHIVTYVLDKAEIHLYLFR